VDFYINFTLRQWTGRVERAHIIFSHDGWGRDIRGEGHKAQGAAPPVTTLAPPMPKNFLNKAPFPRIKDMYVLVCICDKMTTGMPSAPLPKFQDPPLIV